MTERTWLDSVTGISQCLFTRCIYSGNENIPYMVEYERNPGFVVSVVVTGTVHQCIVCYDDEMTLRINVVT